MAALEAKRRMKNLLMFFPNLIALCGRLLMDRRVPRAEKALLAGAVIYALVPLDFIPDMIPFVGQVDDMFLIALTLTRLLERTDESVIREHWRGGGDVVRLVESVATIAPLILPKRIRRVLSSRVEVAPKGARETLLAAAGADALLVEIPDEKGKGGER